MNIQPIDNNQIKLPEDSNPDISELQSLQTQLERIENDPQLADNPGEAKDVFQTLQTLSSDRIIMKYPKLQSALIAVGFYGNEGNNGLSLENVQDALASVPNANKNLVNDTLIPAIVDTIQQIFNGPTSGNSSVK